MDFVSSAVVYILLWWWIFLMALPFGSAPPKNPVFGHASSAPDNPSILKKIIATTLISVIAFIIVKLVIESEIMALN